VPILLALVTVVLVLAAGSASGSGGPYTLTVNQQPTETLKLSTIDPAPTVTVTDVDENPVADVMVDVTLETVSGTGTLTGTDSVMTDENGVATFNDLAVTDPGTYKLVATFDTATVESDPFAVDDLLFEQQPTETEKNAFIDPAPTVTIRDPDGLGIPGLPVHVELETVSGTGSFMGSTQTETTNGDGVATFDELAVDDSGQYKLVATSDNATVTSNGFIVADEVTPCHGGSCSAHGSKPGTTVDASSTNAGDGSSLAVSVIQGIDPPDDVCGADFVPLGAGAFVDILSTGTARPDITVTWRLAKPLVKAAGNPGASKFDICLGAVNLDHPDGTGVTPWTTKSGAPAVAVPDSFLGVTLFWGRPPNCSKKVEPSGPCVLSRFKNNAGDELVTFLLPAPWDASFHGG
jgi:hypothetical protein